MDSLNALIIPLFQGATSDEKYIGGKAYKLARLIESGHKIPNGFCITIVAYKQFIKANNLQEIIKFELGRKSFDSMRWEEIWDAALRIRSAFQNADIPSGIKKAIINALKNLGEQKVLVVRSSAPKEDSARASFAGLHESYVGVTGEKGLLDAVRSVWASLWSDAALLYQHELGLDPLQSAMAVVVQELVEEHISGVAFGNDPRNPQANQSIIEAVPGLCRDLVDGNIDPDRWLLNRSTGEIVETQLKERKNQEKQKPLLESNDIKRIYNVLQDIELLFGWSPDIEWTGRANRFTLLQARPVTTAEQQSDDDKAYYLTLRPGELRLKNLAIKVTEELIPQLEAEGEKLANENLSGLTDQKLADVIESRQQSLNNWKGIYWDDFIPFAHGVRHLATYYNDAVHPEDPYEFVTLLRAQNMISTRRNQRMMELAVQIKTNSFLQEHFENLISDSAENETFLNLVEKDQIKNSPGKHFLKDFQEFLDVYMDVSYDEGRVKNQSLLVLKNILEMAKSTQLSESGQKDQEDIRRLEQKLYDAVGPDRYAEAKEVLNIGRLSWRIRDDDNLLLGRIESQCYRAIQEGIYRLQSVGRLVEKPVLNEKTALIVKDALWHADKGKVIIPFEKTKQSELTKKRIDAKPRQLIGQPASPGLVSGKVRIVRSSEDLGKFKAGEILVCDAIQPNITHLVLLSNAIIERRGGMLIHGAIIAREMGIPCVNGVPEAADLLENGELVTVDGYLGIVTIGDAEFDLETGI